MAKNEKTEKSERASWGTAGIIVLGQADHIRERIRMGWPITRIYAEDFGGEKSGVSYDPFRRMVRREIGSLKIQKAANDADGPKGGSTSASGLHPDQRK